MEERKAPVSQQQFGHDWAEGTVKAFQDAMKEQGVNVGTLYKSFLYNILIGSEGNLAAVQLRMKFYGRFVDMGAGRGITARGQRTAKTKRERRAIGRKKKPIYNKPLTGRVKFLRTAVAEDYKIYAITVMDTLKKTAIDIKL